MSFKQNRAMHPNLFVNRLRIWIDASIQRRLLVWSTFFWLFSVAVLGLTFWQVGQAQILNETRQRNVQLASVISRDVNAKIGDVFSDIRGFSRRLEQLGPDSDRDYASLLPSPLDLPQHTGAVYIFGSDGDMVYSFEGAPEIPNIGRSGGISSRPPVRPNELIVATYRAASSGGNYLSDVTFNGIERNPVCYVGTRISPTRGNTSVAVFQVDLRDIWQLAELTTIGQSGFAYVVSGQGVVVAHPDPAYLGRRIPTVVEPLVSGFEGSITYMDPLAGERVLAAYSPVGGSTGWGIVIQQGEAELGASVVSTGIFVIGILAALWLVGSVGIVLLVRNFTSPIEELTATTQGIASTGFLAKTTMAYRDDEIGQLSRAFDEMIERLQATEGRVATAAADERNRLARDLHDAVTQTLFSASLISEVLPVLWERNENEGRKRLEEVRQLTRGALAEMRTLLLELRPSAIVEAEMGQLLRQLVESVAGRARIPVTVEVDGQCPIPNEVKVALYRISQEALNNISKHSGASVARVRLLCENGQVMLTVADDGRGFETAGVRPESLGLGIMRERAADIGASLTIESGRGQGTEVKVVWEDEQGKGGFTARTL